MLSVIPRTTSVWACAIYGLLLFSRLGYFAFQPDTVLVAAVPDDAFYYLELAQNFAASGKWSFDSQAAASGFHLLYGYLLALWYWFAAPQWQTSFFVFGIINSSLCVAGAYCALRGTEYIFKRALPPIAITPFLERFGLFSATGLLETALVIALMAWCFRELAYSTITERTPGRLRCLGLFALGILGSLARTDFGLFIGVAFCCSLALQLPKRSILASACLLAGCITGIGLIFLHTFSITGLFLQASAATKTFWSAQIGHNANGIWGLIRDGLTSPFALLPMALKQIITVLLGVYSLVLLQQQHLLKSTSTKHSNASNVQAKTMIKTSLSDHWARHWLASSALITLLAALFVYSRNSQALQFWYYGNLLIPCSIVLTVWYLWLFRARPQPLYIILVGCVCAAGLVLPQTPFPGQATNYTIAKAIDEFIPHANDNVLIGSWNAGIYRHVSKTNIVNLDGLVNDEIFPYLQGNNLYDYIAAREIRFLLDGADMFSNPVFAKRGGYWQDNRFSRCFQKRELPSSLQQLGAVLFERLGQKAGC